MSTLEFGDSDQVFIFRRSSGQGGVHECSSDGLLVLNEGTKTRVYIGGEQLGLLFKFSLTMDHMSETIRPPVFEFVVPNPESFSGRVRGLLERGVAAIQRLKPFANLKILDPDKGEFRESGCPLGV